MSSSARKKRVFLVGTINFMTITAEVAISKFVIIIIKVERKRTYGNELRVTLHPRNY